MKFEDFEGVAILRINFFNFVMFLLSGQSKLSGASSPNLIYFSNQCNIQDWHSVSMRIILPIFFPAWVSSPLRENELWNEVLMCLPHLHSLDNGNIHHHITINATAAPTTP